MTEQALALARTLEEPADIGRLLERIGIGGESTAVDADEPQKITHSSRSPTAKTNSAANKSAAKKG